MIGGGDRLPLRDRGMIGDTGTAALVAADGTVDWWCPGRFDAPAAFFRLLDPEGGALRVGPAGPPRPGVQSYEPSTNVLRTVLPAPGGELELTDFLPWQGGPGPGRGPGAGRIVRLVTARSGRIDVDVDVAPASGFRAAREVGTWSRGIAFEGIVVHTPCAMEGRHGRFTLEPGEQAVVVAEARPPGPRRPAPLSLDQAHDLLDRTRTAWRSHLVPLAYDGPHRSSVERSLLVLKALTYGPTGTVVAAPTTSLPERVGGERNWDYRYAWVRDASLAVDASYDAGLVDEGERFIEWLCGVLGRSDGFPLRPVYDVDGLELDPDGERELELAGWRRSQPVRVGNGAADHLQLDFYADLVSAIHLEQLDGGVAGSLADDLWPSLAAMADWLADAWRGPDRGIWEIRCEPRHLVSSKLACWYALDRMVRLARARNPLDLDAVHWFKARAEILAWLEANALATGGGLRADTSPTDRAEASLVQLAWRNPWPGDEAVVHRTVDRVVDLLGTGAFVHRYGAAFPDGLPPGEGAFLACSFWTVEALARLGRWDEAHDRM
ncbi:MAG TPA: glycoside hydrolase family 15 protein, partial [Acidimicrobiales bacterium]|nr:glycoside hydrolase family 15 protein [Acidimicrobiales bacterium]